MENEDDPITRFEAHLIEQGLMTQAQCDQVWEKWRNDLNEALKAVLQEPLASDRDRFIFKEA